MRVCIVIPYGINRSGLEIASVRLSIQLKQKGYHVKILEKGESHALYGFPIRGLPNIFEIGEYLINNHKNYDILYWAGLFENDIEVIEQIILSERLRFSYNKKISFFLERTGKSEPLDDPTLYRRIAEVASKVTVANSEQKRQLVDRKYQPEMVEILPTGVDTKNEFHPATRKTKLSLRQKLGLRKNLTIGIYTGRFVPRKELDLLLDGWSYISKKDTLLLLIGSGFDDPLSNEKQIKKIASKCDNVKIVKYTDGLKRSDYYCVSDFAVFAGKQEGEPTALVESMSCGLPVIASNISGHKELVTSRFNGLLFEVGNRTELIECINKMMESTSLRINWGRNSRSIAVKMRDIEVIASKFISLLQQD